MVCKTYSKRFLDAIQPQIACEIFADSTALLPKRYTSTPLETLANSIGVTKEALIEASLDDLLNKSAEEFQKTSDYVLRKNAELYRRLS